MGFLLTEHTDLSGCRRQHPDKPPRMVLQWQRNKYSGTMRWPHRHVGILYQNNGPINPSYFFSPCFTESHAFCGQWESSDENPVTETVSEPAMVCISGKASQRLPATTCVKCITSQTEQTHKWRWHLSKVRRSWANTNREIRKRTKIALECFGDCMLWQRWRYLAGWQRDGLLRCNSVAPAGERPPWLTPSLEMLFNLCCVAGLTKAWDNPPASLLCMLVQSFSGVT